MPLHRPTQPRLDNRGTVAARPARHTAALQRFV